MESSARRARREPAAPAPEGQDGLVARLRESEERYRLLADLIPQHIWTTDPAGYHGFFSQRWYDFTGATYDETKGEQWLRFVHPEDRDRTIERWQHSLATGAPYSIEYRFRRKDGEYCWFLGQALPQRDASGAIIGWFGTLTDISDRKRLEAEREELQRSRSRLLRGFSHDVKNPLGAADGYAELLEDGIFGTLSEKQLDSVRRMRRSIKTSLHLIHELLELARAEAGQIDLACVPTNVTSVACETGEDFRARATAKGLALELDLPDRLVITSDASRVRQVLSNLVSNAVKYTAEGTVRISATRQTDASPQRTGEWVAVTIADTGPGIPADKHDEVFHEFTRFHTTGEPGAGVGLSISRRLARILGGDITLASEVGRGSEFTLWLPAR